jgi:lysophospholipase L1-like esterase
MKNSRRPSILAALGAVTLFAVLPWPARGEEAAKPPDAAKAEPAAGAYFLQPKDVVMFFGDSITEMAKPEVEFLMADIKKQYPDLAQGAGQVKMVLSGSGGDVARYGAERLKKALDTFKPTVCVVCYGMNETGWKVEKTLFEPHMKNILKQLKEAKVAVIVAAPPPISVKKLAPGWAGDRFVDAATRLPWTAEQARKLAVAEGVLFVDTFAAFKSAAGKDNQEFTIDGVHPNADGFRVMADALQKAWGFGKPLAAAGAPRPAPSPAPDATKEDGSKGPTAPGKPDSQTTPKEK